MKNPEIPEDGVNRVSLEAEENYAANERLDVWVTRKLPKISRSRVQKLISEGAILHNGAPAKASTVMAASDTVEVTFPHPPRPPASPEDIPLNVVFEDDSLAVINKKAGMVVHPAAGHHSGTMVNALLGRYGEELPKPGGATVRPGIVHRLDKDTSGLIVVAKSEHAMTALGRLFHEHDIEREYVALVWGDPEENEGTIDAPIGRHPSHRKKFAINRDGKHAVTHWRVIERFELLTLVGLTLETGRTHQIRVHMASRGWPIVADETYGGNMKGIMNLRRFHRHIAQGVLKRIDRQALHARVLGFIHPETKEQMHFEAPLPNDFKAVLDYLRSQLEAHL